MTSAFRIISHQLEAKSNNIMKKYTPSERKEILKKFKKKFHTDKIEYLGYDRYSITEKYQKVIKDVTVFPTRLKMLIDSEGNVIPLQNNYDYVFGFTLGVAVIRVNGEIQIENKETGTFFSREDKEGLIDINGKELLPPIYDSINVKLDGFVEIKKEGQNKFTNLQLIIDGKFDWEKAHLWH